MDSVKRSEKPHVLCIPLPAQGHINPMLKLAKLLHFNGFYITFVHTEFNYNRIRNSNGSSSLEGFEDFNFETIPDGLPPSYPNATPDIPAFWLAIRTKFAGPFRNLITRINESAAVPSVTCIISDNFMRFALDVAVELGIPDIVFCIYGASGFMGLVHSKELIDRGLLPLRSEDDLTNGYLETPVDWIPGLKNMRLKDLPSFVPTTDPNDPILNLEKDESAGVYSKATAIILHTFDALERFVLQEVQALVRPPVYAIGPLHLLCRQTCDGPLKSAESSLWKADFECLKWLDGRQKGSVVYVSFGSLSVMTNQQLMEIVWGVANSGYNFLLVIRDDITMAGSDGVLIDEVLDKTSGRGFLTSWCPQEEVLMHPSVAAFLTHCGWNSTIESISLGVPMICRPFFADQATNCRLACSQWGIGVEICDAVKRAQVEEAVKVLMEGEMAKAIRKKALEWKKCATEATEAGGHSYLSLQRLIKEVLLYKKQ